MGGLPKNKGGGLGQFADLRGGAWQEPGGGVFEGGVDTPMHTMVIFTSQFNDLIDRTTLFCNHWVANLCT